MTVLPIVTQEDDVLRAETEPITQFDDSFQALVDDMIETMRDANGVGLAAPQIGRSLKLAVVETLPRVDDDGEDIPDSRELFVLVNPKVVWESRKQVDGIEGCLSIPGYLGEVTRSHAIRVQMQDRNGKRRRFSLRGWDARIFLHEIDHINGVMYTDKLTEPENYWSEEEYRALVEESAAVEDDSAETAEA